VASSNRDRGGMIAPSLTMGCATAPTSTTVPAAPKRAPLLTIPLWVLSSRAPSQRKTTGITRIR
jgi:hypothetical protein